MVRQTLHFLPYLLVSRIISGVRLKSSQMATDAFSLVAVRMLRAARLQHGACASASMGWALFDNPVVLALACGSHYSRVFLTDSLPPAGTDCFFKEPVFFYQGNDEKPEHGYQGVPGCELNYCIQRQVKLLSEMKGLLLLGFLLVFIVFTLHNVSLMW